MYCVDIGIEYCTGEGAECRKINGLWTCICVDGYKGFDDYNCAGLVMKNIYGMYSF